MRGMMMTREGLPRARARVVQGWTLPWVVLLLSVGVIGMHSLGATHHPAVAAHTSIASHDTVHVLAAPAHTERQAALDAGPRAAELAGGHGLMAMCLAVLPLLGLLLRRAGRSRERLSRNQTHLPRAGIGGMRAGPSGGAAVSLVRLCILRT